ncbi:MAG: hypothetical protein HQ518_23085 [Rhodopirellula sp.]|nr:hypothetical protein [Rhodopirellula sp.]
MSQEAATTELSATRFDVSWLWVLCSGWFAAFFVYFSYIPLWHTDIWGHVAYGQWMLDHGRLPAVDPFVELAQSTPLIDTAWLSQLLFGWLERSGGPERLSVAYAVISISIYLLLAILFLLRTQRVGLAVIGSILTWLIGWDRHLVIRPELLGGLCFVVLLTLLTAARLTGFNISRAASGAQETSMVRRWGIRGAVALLFVVWVNLHGSFAVGLVAVGILTAGALVEEWWRSRSIRRLLTQAATREPLVLLLIASVATLVNPYGIELPLYVATFGSHPNMASISEWQPPEITSVTGLAVAGASALFLATLSLRRHRPTLSEWLLLIVFTIGVCVRERMVTWYAPVAGLSLMPGLLDLLTRMDLSPRVLQLQRLLDRRARIQTALVVLFVWLAFSFSPISQPVLGGRRRPAEQLFRNQTPLGITMYLRKAVPTGQIANPQWWGDWLSWAGPPGLRVMMTTNSVHLVPATHFQNYTAISWAHAGLKKRLDDYGIELIVVDTSLQTELAKYIRQSSDWQIDYEDSQGFVASRKRETQ